MSEPVIVVDVGNTSTAIACYRGGRVSHVAHVRGGIRSHSEKCAEAVASIAQRATVAGAVVASVVPPVNGRWTALLRRHVGRAPLFVSHRLKLGVGIDYPKPASIGADRLANAAAALHRYGAPVIVADFGTALTFDIVDARGCYVGGVIAPGLPVMTDYLADRTALLPHIKLKGPHGAIGRSTTGAMRLGAKVGYRGMVREIVDYLEDVLNDHEAHLCATGGFARWVLEGISLPFSFEPNLTLRGLGEIFELNA